jgi:hypothetical protein
MPSFKKLIAGILTMGRYIELDLVKGKFILHDDSNTRTYNIKYTDKGIQMSGPVSDGKNPVPIEEQTTFTYVPRQVEDMNIVTLIDKDHYTNASLNAYDLELIIKKWQMETKQAILTIDAATFFKHVIERYEARISALEKKLGGEDEASTVERLTNLEMAFDIAKTVLEGLIERQEDEYALKTFAKPEEKPKEIMQALAASQAYESPQTSEVPKVPESILTPVPIPQPQPPATGSYKIYKNLKGLNAVLEYFAPDRQRTIYLFTPKGIFDKDKMPVEKPEPDIAEKYAYWRAETAQKSESK